MIDFKLKYQSTLFMNLTDIVANQKNISELMGLFSDKGFIPTIFQEINPIQRIDRIRLQSANNEWGINIGSQRIDIEKSPTNQKGTNLGGLSDYCKESIDFSSRLIKHLDRKSSRLASVSQYLLREMSNDQLNSCYTKLFIPTKTYLAHLPFEWDWRSASTVNKTINNSPEDLYFVSSVNRRQGEYRDQSGAKKFDRIELKFDLNTSPANVNQRFGEEEVADFLSNASMWEEELKSEFTNLLSDGDQE